MPIDKTIKKAFCPGSAAIRIGQAWNLIIRDLMLKALKYGIHDFSQSNIAFFKLIPISRQSILQPVTEISLKNHKKKD